MFNVDAIKIYRNGSRVFVAVETDGKFTDVASAPVAAGMALTISPDDVAKALDASAPPSDAPTVAGGA